MKDYLTTREVAELLRLGERKIYELVADGAIPVSRATGKLLFPRDLIDAWVRQHVDYRGDIETLTPPPPVVAMPPVTDPALQWLDEVRAQRQAREEGRRAARTSTRPRTGRPGRAARRADRRLLSRDAVACRSWRATWK